MNEALEQCTGARNCEWQQYCIYITSPQSNLRRARRKGPIGSDDIVRLKIDPRPASRR